MKQLYYTSISLFKHIQSILTSLLKYHTCNPLYHVSTPLFNITIHIQKLNCLSKNVHYTFISFSNHNKSNYSSIISVTPFSLLIKHINNSRLPLINITLLRPFFEQLHTILHQLCCAALNVFFFTFMIFIVRNID